MAELETSHPNTESEAPPQNRKALVVIGLVVVGINLLGLWLLSKG